MLSCRKKYLKSDKNYGFFPAVQFLLPKECLQDKHDKIPPKKRHHHCKLFFFVPKTSLDPFYYYQTNGCASILVNNIGIKGHNDFFPSFHPFRFVSNESFCFCFLFVSLLHLVIF